MSGLVSIADLDERGLEAVLDLSVAPLGTTPLSGMGVAMLFEHPSSRTRNACEMAVVGLGGHPVAISASELGIDSRESAEDVARTLACYHAVIAARVARHSTLVRMHDALVSAGSGTFVVNLLSDREHPTEALGDLLTIKEHFGALSGRVITYVGDANNVARSLVGAAALCGAEIRLASPSGYELTAADIAWAESLGGSPQLYGSPLEAARGAEVLYTDVWTSMGQDAEREARLEAFRGYGIDEHLLEAAAPGAVVMHCLPAHRGEEISASVIDGPQSVVWKQAANRMHAISGLLRYLLGEERDAPGSSGGARW
ncbi:MAG: ornithine carbamoyltransferase [Acidimicrobiales bacterium]